MQLDGTIVRRISAEQFRDVGRRIEEGNPDGEWQAVISPSRGVFLMRPDTSEVRLLYERSGIHSPLRWSPDGREIAVIADCAPSGLTPGELIVVRVADGQARTVAKNVFCRAGFDW